MGYRSGCRPSCTYVRRARSVAWRTSSSNERGTREKQHSQPGRQERREEERDFKRSRLSSLAAAACFSSAALLLLSTFSLTYPYTPSLFHTFIPLYRSFSLFLSLIPFFFCFFFSFYHLRVSSLILF